MEFEWDAEKDATNRAKHGLGLDQAARLDWARAKRVLDTRLDYGEPRIKAFAYLEARLHVCVFTLREGRYRIISLRKANRREERSYGQT